MNRLLVFIICLVFFKLESQTLDPLMSKDFLDQNIWVDSIYNNLSIDEKIGQLFFVQATSKKENNSKKILDDINNHKIGGVIFSTAYHTLTTKLKPFAKSIMYGEACSAVPVFKKPK